MDGNKIPTYFPYAPCCQIIHIHCTISNLINGLFFRVVSLYSSTLNWWMSPSLWREGASMINSWRTMHIQSEVSELSFPSRYQVGGKTSDSRQNSDHRWSFWGFVLFRILRLIHVCLNSRRRHSKHGFYFPHSDNFWRTKKYSFMFLWSEMWRISII